MPRISVDPTEIKKHPKFHAFRKKLDWQPHHAFGFLCAFWGEVLNTEANESGDISDWTPEYLADRIGTNNVDPDRLWEALVHGGYIEVRENDQFVARDWIEIAGPVLREKWRFRKGGREHLVEIWRLHRRVYPGQNEAPGETTVNSLGPHSDPTVGPKSPKERTIQGWEISVPSASLSTPLPPTPSSEDLKASISPSGSDAPSAVAPRSENSLPAGERRNLKVRPLVHVLCSRFKKRLSENAGEPVPFAFEVWGKHVRELLDAKFDAWEIDRRFENWLASTDPFVCVKLNNAGMFHQHFPALKAGPIPNRGRSNGRDAESFDDGAATVRLEHPQPVEP